MKNNTFGNNLKSKGYVKMGNEKMNTIAVDKKISTNPSVVLRVESDDWALLYDPDTGKSFAVNPVSVLIWKHLDGEHTVKDLLEVVNKNCVDVPGKAEAHIKKFIGQLFQKGMAQYNEQQSRGMKSK